VRNRVLPREDVHRRQHADFGGLLACQRGVEKLHRGGKVFGSRAGLHDYDHRAAQFSRDDGRYQGLCRIRKPSKPLPRNSAA
jgi:hypothetical protein